VVGVVEAQAAHRADVRGRQRREQQPDVDDLVRDAVRAEDVPRDDARPRRLGDVGAAARQDGVAVVRAAVPGEEADEALVMGGQRCRPSSA